jgi:5,6,7,8-tetrahydromethanopterin hydro-lyase
MFGPAQAAVARAVVDCVESDIIQKKQVNDIYIIVSVYIDKNAEDKMKIFDNNYQATKIAIDRAYKNEPTIEYLLKTKEKSKHPLF